VFGGPQVPDKPEQFLRDHPFIDVVIHNEGERTFLRLLEQYPKRHWREMTGISFIDTDGSFFKTAPCERMRDLSELPSPFLNGIFDRLLDENPQEKWIGLWETNRGCPFQCTFCDWGSATAAKVSRFELDRLYGELEWFVRKKIEYIFVCDANFGSQKRDVEIVKRVAELRHESGYPQGFSVQNTKNATERAYITQKILADAGLNKGVALSMQSLDKVTLENIKRDNISLETYLELSRRFTRDKVETYADLILALPGETYDSYVDGVDTLINSGQHNRIQFNNLSILPNAEMGDPDYLTKFKMVTVRSAIINIHGSKEMLADDVPEMQDIVIATYSMNPDEWRKSRAISWMIAFLYFDKIAQLPIVILHELANIPYRDIFEIFMDVDRREYPVVGDIRDFFIAEAQLIQDGGVEYKYSEEWLGIYWPADEYAFIKLTAEGRMTELYKEIEKIFISSLSKQASTDILEAVQDSLRINRLMVSQPMQSEDVETKLSFNVVAFWRGICAGEPVPLIRGNYHHTVLRKQHHYSDFQCWCREIVWWGNKKGAYLYAIKDLGLIEIGKNVELAGHY
jgi:tRNA A37 methylthiotransferase MiaB